MAVVRLFHGTSHSFEAFDDLFARRGTEPNSALGIHLTDRPEVAAHYASLSGRDRRAGDARVVVVEAEVSKVALSVDRADFLGRGEGDPFEATRPASDFVAARLRLVDEGFHAVAGEGLGDDLEGSWVVMEPSRLRIVGTMTPAEAEALGEEWDAFHPDVEFAEAAILEETGSALVP